VGHHPLFQRVELFLRKIFVYVAPKHFVCTAGFTHDRFVFRGAAGVFAGIDYESAMIRKHAFFAARDLFVEFGVLRFQ
jgi:hypothetical protein